MSTGRPQPTRHSLSTGHEPRPLAPASGTMQIAVHLSSDSALRGRALHRPRSGPHRTHYAATSRRPFDAHSPSEQPAATDQVMSSPPHGAHGARSLLRTHSCALTPAHSLLRAPSCALTPARSLLRTHSCARFSAMLFARARCTRAEYCST